jgi:hydroxyisourate hydrolase
MSSEAATPMTKQPPPPTVAQLLAKPRSEIVEFLGGIYEHSPWVPEGWLDSCEQQQRNSASTAATEATTATATVTTVTQLASAMKRIVDSQSQERKLELLRAHPDLCEKVERLQQLTRESREEQARSGLASLTEAERDDFLRHNAQYRLKFGFPFILAVRNATKRTVLAALRGRLQRTQHEQELATALEQVHKIAWMRLLAIVDTSEARGCLTCHVLDTANGRPGACSSSRAHCILLAECAWFCLFLCTCGCTMFLLVRPFLDLTSVDVLAHSLFPVVWLPAFFCFAFVFILMLVWFGWVGFSVDVCLPFFVSSHEAAGMRIELFRVTVEDDATVWTKIRECVTNDDGRLEGGPALGGGSTEHAFAVGTYEWMFYVGDYFAATGTPATSGIPFLDLVPLRFGIDSPDDHYHVPLLVSPWSYSTYRGS